MVKKTVQKKYKYNSVEENNLSLKLSESLDTSTEEGLLMKME